MKHRMRNRIICGIVLSSGGVCLGALFTWDGDEDSKWSECKNWQANACSGFPGYPSTTNDDVIIAIVDDVELITEQIDDLHINNDVTFDGGSGAVLTVDSLSITGGLGFAFLRVKGGATLIVDGTN